MTIAVEPTTLAAIAGMRDRYRAELACQVVHDSWHARGFARPYLLRDAGEVVGYGAVGGAPGDGDDTLKEFWVVPARRALALPLFRALAAAGGARWVEAQTNDPLLHLMLLDAATDVTAGKVLFDDRVDAALAPPPGATFRRALPDEVARAFPGHAPPFGEWVVEVGGAVVAAGGVLFHYNPPYGDLFMDVVPAHRRRGCGSWLVQELKRACRAMGRVPAARCDPDNVASRRTLERAGMLPCARILRGRLERGA